MEQRTAEWFEARRGRVTASMVGAILGNSPNMTRDECMRRMVRDWHGAESEFTGNIATEYGVNNEAGALAEYQMETGHTVDAVGFVTRDEWAGCSPDGLVSIFGGVEVKCPFGLRAAEKPVPFKPIAEQPHYYDQVQFSLWVTERAWWDFYQWTAAETRMERVVPDAAWRRKNLPKLIEFWDKFCEERQQDNAAKHLEAKRKIVDTPEAQRIMAEYDQICEAIDNATSRKADLIADMVRLAGGKDAVFAGRNLTLVKRAGSISYAKAIRELAPDADLEKWRGKPSEGWQVK
jgi:putative phage-type endonuclease